MEIQTIKKTNVLFYCLIEVPFHGSKKNSKQIRFNKKTRRSFVTSNDRVINVQNYLILKLRQEKHQLKETIGCSVNVRFTFYIPESKYFTKKGIRSKNIPDQSNLYELPQDVMQSVGIIQDDGLIESHDGSRRAPIKGDKHLLEIEITKV